MSALHLYRGSFAEPGGEVISGAQCIFLSIGVKKMFTVTTSFLPLHLGCRWSIDFRDLYGFSTAEELNAPLWVTQIRWPLSLMKHWSFLLGWQKQQNLLFITAAAKITLWRGNVCSQISVSVTGGILGEFKMVKAPSVFSTTSKQVNNWITSNTRQ